MATDAEFVRRRGSARAQRIAAKLGITDELEELLDGPMSSPVRMGAQGPEQTGQRHHPILLEGLSRGRVSPRLQEFEVREGVKVANLLAVADLAQDMASVRDAGGDYRGWLSAWASRYRSEIRAWISGGPTDARLAEFLDSFVHRTDKQQVESLQKALDRAQVPDRDRGPVWAAYDQRMSRSDDGTEITMSVSADYAAFMSWLDHALS